MIVAACRYYEEKGFEVILVSRVLNLLALAFTIAFSAFLLLFVKWHALRSECILKDTCDISEVRTSSALLQLISSARILVPYILLICVPSVPFCNIHK